MLHCRIIGRKEQKNEDLILTRNQIAFPLANPISRQLTTECTLRSTRFQILPGELNRCYHQHMKFKRNHEKHSLSRLSAREVAGKLSGPAHDIPLPSLFLQLHAPTRMKKNLQTTTRLPRNQSIPRKALPPPREMLRLLVQSRYVAEMVETRS